MNNKIFTVAILGCGSRGAASYGNVINSLKDKFKIVALCDLVKEKIERYQDIFDVEKENCFLDCEEFLAKKRADVLIIANQDQDHVWCCLRALELGYDVLLEKPITDKLSECEKLLEAQRKYGRKIMVCHVLRYAPAFIKVNELLVEENIGKLVAIQAIEQVHYWHQAHSYVRGNWRRKEETSPMILAKCCHDLDLIQYYAKSSCISVSSIGDLVHFKEENAPKDCAKRCLECKYIETCPYSAKRIYVDRWKITHDNWPTGVITVKRPLNEEVIYEALKEGPYGRCVYYCDNNVVDHQIVQMEFKNGVKASLTMMAFTGKGGRIYKFYGTHGEINLDEENQKITIKRFGQPDEIINFDALLDVNGGHGGGDLGLISALYDMLVSNNNPETSLEASIESHLIGINAEESRLNNGKLIYLHKK